MKLFTITAIILISAFAPMRAKAESIWLVYATYRNAHNGMSTNMDKIEMSSIEQCEAEGSKLKVNESFKIKVFDRVSYACVKGK